jgi:REP element-mobilizing transposase RayT
VLDDDVRVYSNKLPHFRLDGATYFVTWRVDVGVPDLAPAERTAVMSALRHFDGIRYELIACVVMNDHVHVLVTPREPYQLEQLLHSWRGYTTHVFHRAGRQGRVWQREYMDRIVRNGRDFRRVADYVVSNPQARWPECESYEWVWANWMDEGD